MPGDVTSARSAAAPPGTLTHSGALAWLLDVRQRLRVSIDLVDHGLTPVLPPAEPRSQSTRHSALDIAHRQLHPAILDSMRTLKQEAISVDGVNVVSTPIVGTDGRAAGALLVSDRGAAQGTGGGSDDLARIGMWLAGSIDAQFASALAIHAVEFRQLASLHRLLNRVTRSGSEHELVRAFMDAVAVWQDAESWGYVRDLAGRFVRVVSLPGSHDETVPEIIDEGRVADGVIRLSAEQRHALGFQSAGDVLVARVAGSGGAEWLIAVRGSMTDDSEARLALYGDVLGRALTMVAGVESSQLTWALLLHLMHADDDPRDAASRAIDEVSRALDGDASFAVLGRDDAPVLAVGPSRYGLLAHTGHRSGWLAVPVKVGPPFSAAIAIHRRADGPPLTRADEKRLQSAALTLAFWLNDIVDRLPGGSARRAVRSFEQLIDQQAHDALARGEQISLMVVSVGRRAIPTPVARSWIGTIRASLRPADVAGWLSSGDIAILLPGTSADGAEVVADRVRAVVKLESDDTAAVSIGIVTRGSESVSSQPLDNLLLDARLLAANRTH